MTRWFRLYDNVLDDPKVQGLPPALFKAWINLLCVASKHDGKLPNVASLAFLLRKPEKAVASDIAALRAAGLIDDDGNGGQEPHNWQSRQYVSDTSRERTKRYRQRLCDVTRTVTATSPVTPPDTDTDTDTDIIHFPAERVAPRATHKSKTPIRSCRFPETGSIAYREPFSTLAKRHCPGVDPDRLAGLFRAWCQQKQMSLDQDGISNAWATFCKTHRDRARTG